MRWAAAALASVLLIGMACSPPTPRAAPPPPVAEPSATPSPAPTRVSVQAVEPRAAVAVRPVASPSPLVLPLASLAGRSGADVRVALDLLLQEQAFLLAATLDAVSNVRLDEQIGVASALDQNSIALAELLGAVKDQTAAHTLLDAWRGTQSDLVQYAQGQKAAASADLEVRRAAIATQLAMGEFSAPEADDLLRKRLQAELALADAISSRAADQASQRLQSLVDASDDLALPLASAIAAVVPDQAPPPTEGLDIDMRLHLARSLQQHVYLTGAAVEAAADNRAADQQALVAVSNDNASDIGAQLGSVYGPDLGSGISDRLESETAALVSAASGGDRQKAAADISRLRGELDKLLSGANQLLPPGLLNQQLRASDQPLLSAADAFAERDFSSAYARLHEAARQSQKPADSLALSIVDRYPGRFLTLPSEPAQ